jgi:hypothetical protein
MFFTQRFAIVFELVLLSHNEKYRDINLNHAFISRNQLEHEGHCAGLPNNTETVLAKWII